MVRNRTKLSYFMYTLHILFHQLTLDPDIIPLKIIKRDFDQTHFLLKDVRFR